MINTTLLIGILLIVDSMHFVFAKMLSSHFHPSVSAFFVLFIATIEVGIYGIATKQLRLEHFRKHAWFFLGIGFFVASSTNLNYAAVTFIDPGTASLLAQTGSIWSLGLGLFWLKEKLTRGQIIGAVLAIAGVFVLTYQAGEYLRIGSLMVLAASLMYSLHSGMTKRYGEGIDFINFFFFRVASTAAFLFVFASIQQAFTWPTIPVWGYLLLVGTMDVVISRSVYYLALRRLDFSIHTLVLTLSPVVTVIWTMIFFDLFPSTRQVLGGITVILGVFIVGKYRQTQA
jgi:drug/metabolite transporter (DMT)-like permease